MSVMRLQQFHTRTAAAAAVQHSLTSSLSSSAGCRCYRRGQRSGLASRRSGGVAVAAEIDWSHRTNERQRRPENVAGQFFVDRTCIDCDTCRWMAPDTFGRVGPQSAVVAQPENRDGRVQALRALLSCPTYSIHATNRSSDELREAQDGLPARVPGMERHRAPQTVEAVVADGGTAAAGAAEGVYYTGWAAESSYAGCPYLIVRPGGNILVDVPRYNPVLARHMEALGGVRWMFLTHRDDVGGHELWAKHFGAARILHEREVNREQKTDKVEIKLSGEGPWVLTRDGSVVPAADAVVRRDEQDGQQPYNDVTFIFTPGHTTGHVCLYYEPYKALFSGDHLSSAAGSVDGAPQDELYIFTRYNWYSVPEQLRSVAKLLQYDWLHVLPAHGRRAHLRDATARLAAVSDLLRRHGAAAAVEGTAATAAAAGGSGGVAAAVTANVVAPAGAATAAPPSA